MPRSLSWLRWVAALEFVSLLVLLLNVAVLGNRGLAAAVGPLHGALYLTVIIALLVRDATPGRVRLFAFVPGVGGFLALRALEQSGVPR